MNRWHWPGLAAAFGLAVLLILAMVSLTLAQSGTSLSRSPAPPESIGRGMTETFTWTVTIGNNTPDRVEFRVLDPDAVMVDSQTYPGTAGLAATRVYTVPGNPKEGRYLGKMTSYSLEAGQEAYASVPFYVAEHGNLQVFKFDDFNGNGLQDPGDEPVPDVLIQLVTPFGDVVSKLTGSDGHAVWENIAIGSYTVTEVVPPGREPTLPPTATVQVEIDATTYVTFANRIPPAAVVGQIWHDEDADGTCDPDEMGLPDIGLRLYRDGDGDGLRDPGEPLADQVDSSPGGFYTFTLLYPGDYVVAVDMADPDLPAGLALLGDAEQPATGLAPGEIRFVPFRFDDSALIGGRVWHDANGNGLVDPGEIALPNIAICLYEDTNGNQLLDPEEPRLECEESSASGSYSFTGLPGGNYIVDLDQNDPDVPAGYQPTTPDPVGAMLGTGEALTVNFGLRQLLTPTPTATPAPTATPTPVLGCIIGRKVDELNVGLPDWTIHARPRDGTEPDLTTVTDGSGDFHFAGLLPGWWTLWEEQKPGWTPVTAAIFDVEVPVGPACVEVRFKNRQACDLDDYEPDDSAAAATFIWPDGIPQKHTLEPPTDVDWVVFRAVAGAVYTLRTDNLMGSTDTTMALYDTDAVTPLDYSDDIVPGSDLRSLIVWRAPANGLYFARVRDYYQAGARGCLGYDLSLTMQAFNYLPAIVRPQAPTSTPTPSATPIPTATFTPSPTRTPGPGLQPFVISGIEYPKGIGVDLGSHRLYAASRTRDLVYEVDPLTRAVLRAIPVGHEPFGVAVNSTTHKVYVANFAGDSLTVIDGLSGMVLKTISFAPYGEPTYVAINENTNHIYIPLHDGGRLAVVNGATDALVTTLPVGDGAFGVAVDPLLNRIYVSCRDSRLIRVVDGTTHTLLEAQTAYTGGEPYALGIDPALGQLYVSFAPIPGNPTQVLAYRIPASGPTLRSAVLVGQGGPDGGGGIAVNPLTHHVFVSNSQEDSVSIFEGVTLMQLITLLVGDNPHVAAFDPELNYAFVGNRGSNSISAIPDIF